MSGTKRNDSDRYVQPRPEGGWEIVRERHQRASAVTGRKADAITRAREIVNNLGGGEVRIKNLDNRRKGFCHAEMTAMSFTRARAPAATSCRSSSTRRSTGRAPMRS
jgi:Uncharacterized protein conserved in bacteria (DUF2188)